MIEVKLDVLKQPGFDAWLLKNLLTVNVKD